MRGRTAGFSLLELVVVLAVFALVALAGVQVIRATVLADQRLSAVSDESGELAVALALLRRDMGAAIGVPFDAPTGAAEPPVRIANDGFALSVSGLGGVDGGDGLGRVVWRHDPASGRLLRRVWTTLSPGTAQAAGPEVTVLDGVTAIAVQSFGLPGGWRPGFAPDPRTPYALPHGLRVQLDHARFDRIETLVALR